MEITETGALLGQGSEPLATWSLCVPGQPHPVTNHCGLRNTGA